MNIESILIENENVLYSFIPETSKRPNDKFLGEVFAIVFMVVFDAVVVGSMIANHTKRVSGMGILLFMTLAVVAICLSSIVKDIKNKKNIAKEKYYITNKRIILIRDNDYEEFYISAIQDTKIIDYKNGYGDVILSDRPIDIDAKTIRSNAQYVIQTYENCKTIKMQSVLNPNEVLNKILGIKNAN